MEAELEGVGAGGVGADPQGVEEAGRVAEAGVVAAKVDTRAEGSTAAALLPSNGYCWGEVEGGRRVRADSELGGTGDGKGICGAAEDGDDGDEEEETVWRRHVGGNEFGDFLGNEAGETRGWKY